MILAHKIALDPTAEQEAYFRRAAGTARFAYNHALAEWRRRHKAGEKPSALKLKAHWNAVRRDLFPWSLEVTKCAAAQAIMDLGVAYKNFFDDLAKVRRGELRAKDVRRPDFKRKGRRDGFALWNDQFAVEGRRIRIPKLGRVRMREALRFSGKILGARVSRVADRWFVSIAVEVEPNPPARESQAAGTVGVDLGLSALATLSTGEVIAGPKPHRASDKRLRRLNRSLARKRKGSSNRAKAKAELARLHRRIADVRRDAVHKLTSMLTTRFAVVGIEDLNVRGMARNRRLARSVGDAALGEVRRQLVYKQDVHGSRIVVHGRWYPSSKTCSACGVVRAELPLSARVWSCDGCGAVHHRDLNAAINLDPGRTAGFAGTEKPVERAALAEAGKAAVKPPATKQEPGTRTCAHN